MIHFLISVRMCAVQFVSYESAILLECHEMRTKSVGEVNAIHIETKYCEKLIKIKRFSIEYTLYFLRFHLPPHTLFHWILRRAYEWIH